MNKKQWYRRSTDTVGSCSSSPNIIVGIGCPPIPGGYLHRQGSWPAGISGPPIQANIKEMSSEAYIFIGGCWFYIGRFRLVHPLSASCFGGSVSAIGGSLPSELPLCSGLESQLSDFLLPVHPNPNKQL